MNLTPKNDSPAFTECIRRSYGSMSEPRWDFVEDALSRQPYRSLVDALGSRLDLHDNTDSNCDVCFTYSATVDRALSLSLSMVGPFAMILGSDPLSASPIEVISSIHQCRDDIEVWAFRLIEHYGFRVLNQGELDRKVPLQLSPESRETFLYSALFHNEDEPPWRLGCKSVT